MIYPEDRAYENLLWEEAEELRQLEADNRPYPEDNESWDPELFDDGCAW